MNNETLTDFAYYSVTDWKNQSVLSSYCLPITPLIFKSKIPTLLNNQTAVWNFGDGTISKELTATHAYEYPGKYTVHLIVYDCSNQARLATYTKDITIYDYITNTLQLSTNNSNTFQLSGGELSQPIVIKSFTSCYQEPPNIFYSVSGSNSVNYFNLTSGKFNHLLPNHCIVSKTYNNQLSGWEIEELDTIEIPYNNIYVKLSNYTIVPSSFNDANSVYVGASGTSTIYYRDDSPSNSIYINFFTDKTNVYYESISGFGTIKYANPLSYTLSAKVLRNTSASKFSITSNGLDNEGNSINSFGISPNKFVGGKIPFIIKVKSAADYTIKTFPQFVLSGLDVKLCGYNSSNTFVQLISSTTVNITSLNNTISSYGGGIARGYIQYNSDAAGLTNAYINVSGSVTDNYSSTYSLSGRSATFNIWPTTKYNIYKNNEDFGMSETYKSLRFQEFLLDKSVLFDDFLNTIVGNVSSTYDSLGKSVYEHIANYSDNNISVDTAEIPQLQSMIQMLGSRSPNFGDLQMPPKIKRAVNLLSIPKAKLFGYKNQFSQNLDNKDVVGGVYGTNLGNKLNTLTYIVTAGTPIVAHERFSGVYTLLNTLQPLSGGVTSNTYALSTYTSNWGWPLVLPNIFTTTDFDKYYTFYSYVSGINGSITSGVIDFNNNQTTISFNTPLSSLTAESGVTETIISKALYQGLDLLS